MPPLCVMLPADDGAHDANLHGRCLQTDPSSLDAALACVPAGSMEPLGDHFRAQFPDEVRGGMLGGRSGCVSCLVVVRAERSSASEGSGGAFFVLDA